MIRQVGETLWNNPPTFSSLGSPSPSQSYVEEQSANRLLRESIPNVLPRQFLRFAQLKKEDPYEKRFQQLLSPNTLSEKEKAFYEELLKFIAEKKIPFKDLCEAIENYTKKLKMDIKDIAVKSLLVHVFVYSLFWDLQHNIRPAEQLRKLGVREEILKKVENFPGTILELLHDGEILFHPGLPKEGANLLLYNGMIDQYGHRDPTWLPDVNDLMDRVVLFHELYHAYQDQTQPIQLEYAVEIDAYFIGSLLGLLSFEKEDRELKVASLTYPEGPAHSQKAVIAASILLKSPHGEEFAKAWENFLSSYRKTTYLNVAALMSKEVGREFEQAKSTWTDLQVVKQILKPINQKLEILLKKYGDEKVLAQSFPDPTDFPAIVRFARENPTVIKDIRSYFYLLAAEVMLVDALKRYGDPEGEAKDAFLKRMLSHPLAKYAYMSLRFEQFNGIERTHIKSVTPWGEASELKALRWLEVNKGLTHTEQEGLKSLFSLVKNYKIPWKDLYDIASSMPKRFKEDKEVRWQSCLLSQWIHYAVMYVLANRFWPFNKTALQNFETPWRTRLSEFRSTVLETLKKWKVVAAPGTEKTNEHNVFYNPSQNTMQTSKSEPFFFPRTAWEWSDYFQKGLRIVLDKEKYKDSSAEASSWRYLSGALLAVRLIREKKMPYESLASFREEFAEQHSPTSSFLENLSSDRDKAYLFVKGSTILAECYLTTPLKRSCKGEQDVFNKHSKGIESVILVSDAETRLSSSFGAKLGANTTHADRLGFLGREAEVRIYSLLNIARDLLNNPSLDQDGFFNQQTLDALLSLPDRKETEETKRNLLAWLLELTAILHMAQRSHEILDMLGLAHEWDFEKLGILEEWVPVLQDKYRNLIKSNYDGL